MNSRPSLSRLISIRSVQVVDTISHQKIKFSKDDEESLIVVLHTIKLAKISNRITEEQANSLKASLCDKQEFDKLILSKLNRTERLVLLDIQGHLDELDNIEEGEEYNEREGEDTTIADAGELEILNRDMIALRSELENQKVSGKVNNICWVCHEEETVEVEGIQCIEDHFQCNSCLSFWVKVINEQRTDNPELFRKRSGHVKCMFDGCNAPHFSRANITNHIKDENICENYLAGLQEIETLNTYAEFQEKLLAATIEIREELNSNNSSPRSEVSSPHSEVSGNNSNITPSITSTLSNEVAETIFAIGDEIISPNNIINTEVPTPTPTRAELAALAETLKRQMPDARQCKQCGFGPIINKNCDDLSSHHGENLGEAQINNSCPSCGWFSTNWREWDVWDGYLPDVISKNAFQLGSKESVSSSVADNEEVPVPVVLSPEEVKKARLKRLEDNLKLQKEKKIEEEKVIIKKIVKEPMTEEQIIISERKRIQEKNRIDRLKIQKERELILKQMKCDHAR
jgi:hypothetical protein